MFVEFLAFAGTDGGFGLLMGAVGLTCSDTWLVDVGLLILLECVVGFVV